MKRFLALFLCFALCLTLLPAASAEDIVIDDPVGADAPGGPLDELVIDPVGADTPAAPTDELVINPVGADAPGGPLDEIVIDPVGADAPGGPLDEIPLVDEPDALAPSPDAEIQSTVASGSCGDSLTWRLADSGELYIEGSGPMANYTGGTAPWYSYRSQITELYIFGGTTIGEYAFYGCSKLKFPAHNGKSFSSTVTSIGKCAFLSCTSLEYVTIPASVISVGMQAFDYCSALKRVTVCGAPTLGNWTFGDCPALEEISFLGGAPYFAGASIFGGSHAATAWYPSDDSSWTESNRQNYGGTITWQAGYHGWCGDNMAWDFDPSTGALTLSGSGTNWYFGGGMQSWRPFRDNIQSVTVSSGIKSLNDYILAWLYYVSSVTLPDTLTEIGESAFYRDSLLGSVKIPKSVTTIGPNAFGSCFRLTEVRFLGHPPASIDSKAFSDVTATAYYFPVYSWTADDRQNYGGALTWNCDDKIGTNAYWQLYENGNLLIFGSSGFATDNFPIEFPGFYNFKEEIKTAEISSDCSRAGNFLLYNLGRLEKVHIYGKTELGDYCFGRCSTLTNILFYDEAPSISPTAFRYVTATAFYPASDPTWTASVMQDYGGDITWQDIDAGFIVTVTSYCGDNVTVNLNSGGSYQGEISFTVLSVRDQAVLVTVKDGNNYTVLPCTPDGKRHMFTLNVTKDTEIVVAFKGDVNLDGAVKSSEATMIKRAIAGTYQFKNGMAELAADVNGDGTVKASDATMLARFIAGTYTIKW